MPAGSSPVAVPDVIGILKAKAEAGDVNAMVDLARRYDKGDGAKQDLKAALAWYEKAANKGSGVAAYEAALRYAEGSGTSRSQSNFQVFLDRASELGYPPGMTLNALVRHKLGAPNWAFEQAYLSAETLEEATRSARDAIALLDRASLGGDPKAEFLRAMISMNGINYKSIPVVKPDRHSGLLLLKTAADKGNWRAALRLATLTEKEAHGSTKGQRDKYWKTVDELRDPEELIELAGIYFPSLINKRRLVVWKDAPVGEEKAYELATAFLKRSAETGSVKGIYELGNHLCIPRGSFEFRGFQVYKGNPLLCPEGLVWLRRAADLGSNDAKRALASIYEAGELAPKDDAEALRLRIEIVNSDVNGRLWLNATELGMMFILGKGTPRDDVQAYAWLNIAKRDGVILLPQVAKTLASLESRLSPEQLTKGQELARNWQPGDGPLKTTAADGGNGRGTTGKNPTVTSNGSAVRIHRHGVLLTNQHVVAGCNAVRRAGTEKALRVLASDTINDLAVIDGDVPSQDAIKIHADTVRLGEDVSTYGFPLSGFLASAGNFTRGQISALSGADNNSSQLQFTAPVQPGSSGGPLLNDYGRLVGLVSSKAHALRIAKATNDIPQNVNFAVSAQTVRTFLTNNKVAYSAGSDSWYSRKLDSTKLAEKASTVTVKLECLK